MTDEYAQAGTAAKRLTEAGFPAVRTSAGYPAYGGGGDEGLDNNSVIVWLHSGTAHRLATELAVLQGLLLSGKEHGKHPLPGMQGVAGEVLRDILLLCDRSVSLEVIAQWTERERAAACEWAALAHLGASDNPVRHVDEPWFVRIAAGIAPPRGPAQPRAVLEKADRLDYLIQRFTRERCEAVLPEPGAPGRDALTLWKAYERWAADEGDSMLMGEAVFTVRMRRVHEFARIGEWAGFPALRLSDGA